MGLQKEELPKVYITFFPKTNFNSRTGAKFPLPGFAEEPSFTIPKDLKLKIKEENIYVETLEDLYYVPSLKLNQSFTRSDDNKFFENDLNGSIFLTRDLTKTVQAAYYHNLGIPNENDNGSGNKSHGFGSDINNTKKSSISRKSRSFFYVFGESPKEGNEFYLGLEYDIRHIEKDSLISLVFSLYESDLPPIGKHGNEHLSDFADPNLKSELIWEYLPIGDIWTFIENGTNKDNPLNDNHEGNASGNSGDETNQFEQNLYEDLLFLPWNKLEVVSDTTDSFSQSGKFTFKFPYEKSELEMINDNNGRHMDLNSIFNVVSNNRNYYSDSSDRIGIGGPRQNFRRNLAATR